MINAPTIIVAPCYNENITVIKFLEKLQSTLAGSDYSFLVVVVDDASIDNTLGLLQEFKFTGTNVALRVISLIYNQGHQGAIYQGLLYAQSLDAQHVIVMDSDGEDDPQAILELVKFQKKEVDIVNVIRGKRKEKLSFRLSYKIYKALFYLITKKSMSFGNYCMINRKIVDATVDTSFIHFAAHLSKQKSKTAKFVYDRRNRLDGKSKMNMNGLIFHAFKSFVEYAEDLLMVFLKLFIVLALAIGVLILVVVYKKIFTDEAIMGWASTLTSSLVNTALICIGFFVIGILLLNIMGKKNTRSNEPLYRQIK